MYFRLPRRILILWFGEHDAMVNKSQTRTIVSKLANARTTHRIHIYIFLFMHYAVPFSRVTRYGLYVCGWCVVCYDLTEYYGDCVNITCEYPFVRSVGFWRPIFLRVAVSFMERWIERCDGLDCRISKR